MKMKLGTYILVFIIGGIGGWILPQYVLPHFGIAIGSPVTIIRREEIQINEGINNTDIANRVKNSVVSVYVHDGTFGTAKFNLLSVVSGVIVSSDGLIVIPYDAYKSEQTITVLLADSPPMPAQIVGSDAYTGLVFLKIDKKDLPVINQVLARHVGAGEKLVSIQKKESAGEILTFPFSARERGIASPSLITVNDFLKPAVFLNLVPKVTEDQFGAVILNKDGAMVGFVTKAGGKNIAVVRTEDFSLGVNNFLDGQKIIWPNFKINYLILSATQAALLGLPESEGILIKSSFGGLLDGDFVTHVDGKQLDFVENFQDRILAKKPGEKVKFKLIRDNIEKEVEIKL